MITTVNAIGDACPIPVVKTVKAINAMTESGIIETHVDNETAVENVSKLAASKGFTATSEKVDDKHFIIKIEVGAPTTADEKEADTFCPVSPKKKNTVVAIASDTMGHGDDELGHTLIKGFIYALSQLEDLPKTILFYNGGAKLTVEGSLSLEDLKAMEAQGVEIMTCGTCLNFYGLSDKLAVGSVSNMYSIVETLAGADMIIKP